MISVNSVGYRPTSYNITFVMMRHAEQCKERSIALNANRKATQIQTSTNQQIAFNHLSDLIISYRATIYVKMAFFEDAL